MESPFTTLSLCAAQHLTPNTASLVPRPWSPVSCPWSVAAKPQPRSGQLNNQSSASSIPATEPHSPNSAAAFNPPNRGGFGLLMHLLVSK